jgi:hypothetical protein
MLPAQMPRPTPPALCLPDFSGLNRGRLETMLAAGAEVRECQRVLERAGIDLVGEVLRGHGTFYELEHYPPDDVFDPGSYSQYYYHAHRGTPGEHGHFHTFMRAPGMPAGTVPVPYSGAEPWPRGKDAISHLIAISMDASGRPIGLFAVNRWVTAEAWYAAADVLGMLDRFVIDHAYPSWPLNRWLSAMLRLFRPQIETLVRHRDQVVEAWRRAYRGLDVFEDRRLEITGELAIDVEQQIARTDAALRTVRAARRHVA